MRRLYQSLHEMWFAPADPRVLAIARVLIFYHISGSLGRTNTVALAKLSDVVWLPISTFKALGIGPPSVGLASTIEWVFWVSNFLALVGLFFPITSLVAALTWFYASGLPQNFGKINHNHLIVLVPFILAFSRAADVWSLDALWKRHFKFHWAPRYPSGEYRWPLAFIATLVIAMYGAAGWSKLIKTGWDWALSDSFRLLLLRHHFTSDPPTMLGVWIANYPSLCKGMALGALCMELIMPLALFSKYARRILIPSCALLQFGIWLTLGVIFRHMIPIFICLFPWQFFLEQLDRRIPTWVQRFTPRQSLSNPAAGD